MKMKIIPQTALLVACTLGLAACGGGGASNTMQASTTTVGQELMDLDESYKKGIITEDQYNTTKKEILERYDK